MTTIPDAAALLAAALAAAEHGWHVFPLLPDSKPPAIKSWEARATTDPDRIRRCWTSGPYNVGIACGPSHLVAIDLDTPKPGAIPPPKWSEAGVRDGADVLAALCGEHGQPYPVDTYTVSTPNGTHHYFAAPTSTALRNTAGQQGCGLGWLIDTRATGGYVVAAGSIVTGRPYNVVHDVDPAPLPAWITQILTPPPKPVAPVVRLDGRTAAGQPAYVAAALRNETANVATAPEGTRNWALTRAARALGRFVANGRLSRGEVEHALKGAAEQAGLPTRDAAATITNALNWSIAHNPAGDAA